MPIDASGYVAERAADYLATIRSDYEAWVADNYDGEVVDWAEDVLLAELAAIMAHRLGALSEVTAAIMDATDPAASQGIQLSTHAAMVGVYRNAASASTASLTLGGVAGTLIPAGAVVQGGGPNGAAQWVTTSDATLDAGGTATVPAKCTEAGAITADIGDIATIVSPIVGWATVTNAVAASTGLATEDDADLRLRRATRLRSSAGRSLDAIRTALLDLDYVDSALVVDNPNETTETVAGLSLPGCSYLAVLYPAPATTERQQEVLARLYEYAPFGIEAAGTDVTGTVAGGDGHPKAVGYDVASTVTVSVVFSLLLATGYGQADVAAALTAEVEAYLLSLRPGETLYSLPLLGLAADQPGVLSATVAIAGGSSYTPTAKQVVRGTVSVS